MIIHKNKVFDIPPENPYDGRLTEQEILERYGIPAEVLAEYHRWGLCGEVKKVLGSWQYNDTDLERLSMILTLRDIGFSNDEVRDYMALYVRGEDTKNERLAFLEKKRADRLEEVHIKERQIARMDYLRGKLCLKK